LVAETLAEVDVIGFCMPADEKVGPGDRFIAEKLAVLAEGRRPPKVVAIATKADLVKHDRLAEHLMSITALGSWADVVPVSATGGYQVETLSDVLLGLLPEGPLMYPEGELTDEPEAVMIGELVREAALEGLGDELPHSLAVVVDEMLPREGRDDGMIEVRVNLFVERSSQKGIMIGRQGARLREIGTNARPAIERLLGVKVYLDLHVKVAKEWQRDPKQLRRLGF
jgi:GTP-binding protein Era